MVIGEAALQVDGQLAGVDVLGKAFKARQVRLRKVKISFHMIIDHLFQSVCLVSSESLVMLLVDQFEPPSPSFTFKFNCFALFPLTLFFTT